MAKVSYAALSGFFDLYPELKASKGLFLTGESYAGVYVPKLAQKILEHGQVEQFNLKGIAVGDACMGNDVLCGNNNFGPWFDYLFLYGHGQFSIKLWDELLDFCGTGNLKYDNVPPVDDAACADAKARVSEQTGGYYAYSLYDECTYENSFRRHRQLKSTPLSSHLPRNGAVQGATNDYVCGGGPVQTMWTDSPVVRAALHVQIDANFFSGDNAVGMNYELDEKNLMPFYVHLAQETDIRAMVYNGDTDPSINSFASQNWTSHLGLAEKEGWRPWTLDGCQQMGGYLTAYEGDFSFVTIRGAGHMVPQYKAPQAMVLISNFIQQKPFAPYVASCSAP